MGFVAIGQYPYKRRRIAMVWASAASRVSSDLRYRTPTPLQNLYKKPHFRIRLTQAPHMPLPHVAYAYAVRRYASAHCTEYINALGT